MVVKMVVQIIDNYLNPYFCDYLTKCFINIYILFTDALPSM